MKRFISSIVVQEFNSCIIVLYRQFDNMSPDDYESHIPTQGSLLPRSQTGSLRPRQQRALRVKMVDHDLAIFNI